MSRDFKYSRGGGSVMKTFLNGSKKSKVRLAQLGFDPIERLVLLYKKLESEDEYWSKVREASLVKELDSEGNVKKVHRYSGMAHSTVLTQMAKISNDLLRYGYGRVPENLPSSGGESTPLVINLDSGRIEDPLVINHQPETHEFEEEDS